MLLQHGFHSVQDGTDHFTEQFVLVPEIIIYVPHTDTDGSGNLAHGGLGIPLLPESLFGAANMRPRMSSLSTCINNERCFRLYFAKVRGLNLLDNTYLW